MDNKIILFFCKGNIHRSVIAEICLRQELEKIGLSARYEIISRGIQGCCGTVKPKYANMTHCETEWSLTKPVLEKLGVDFSEIAKRIARPVSEDDIRRANIVFAMELAILGKNGKHFPLSLFSQFPD